MVATDRLGPIIETAVNKLVTAASESGYFRGGVESVEPKSAPGSELYFATWIEDIKPIQERSGLPVTSCRVEMMGRVYSSMLAEPQDRIDIELALATSYLLAQLTGHFTITGAYIDLLGAHGDALGSDFGYVTLDKTVFRVSDITIPFVCDDVFDQEV